MDFQVNNEKLQDYSTKAKANVKAILWLIGSTVASFVFSAVIFALLFEILVYQEQPDASSVASDIAFYGTIAVSLFLPAALLHWKKIRLGKNATRILTALCGASLMIDLLFVGLAFLLRLINGLFPHAKLFSAGVWDTAVLLFFVIFVRISLLISLLSISENPKRAVRFTILGLSVLEIVLLILFMS